eukprot:767357-Hanusia_phi.AAC.1
MWGGVRGETVAGVSGGTDGVKSSNIGVIKIPMMGVGEVRPRVEGEEWEMERGSEGGREEGGRESESLCVCNEERRQRRRRREVGIWRRMGGIGGDSVVGRAANSKGEYVLEFDPRRKRDIEAMEIEGMEME